MDQSQVQRGHGFKVQKKHSGQIMKTEPIFWHWGQESTACFSGALYSRVTSARRDKGGPEPALGLWSRVDDFTSSQQLSSCMILPWYQLVSLQLPFLVKKAKMLTWETWSSPMARCPSTAWRTLHTNIWKSNSNQHDLLECLPSLQRSPVTLC